MDSDSKNELERSSCDVEEPGSASITPSVLHSGDSSKNVPGQSPLSHQTNENEDSGQCYVCGQNSGNDGTSLKSCSSKMLTNLKKTATLREKLTIDKYGDVTNFILGTSDDTVKYHTSCHRKYTAVKHQQDQQSDEDEPVSKKQFVTRQSNVLPKSNTEGLLKGSCIFCGKPRKKFRGKEETRLKVSTLDGCDSLYYRMQSSNNDRIISLIQSGVDLIAKEAEYHKSCRVQFMKETSQENLRKGSNQLYHKKAFQSLVSFVQKEVLQNKIPFLVSSLLDMYKDVYIKYGGEMTDVEMYSSQNLTRKLKEHFKESVSLHLVDQRNGNFIYSSSLSVDDAKVLFVENDTGMYADDQKLKWAALYLRKEILEIPKTKMPNPATVQNIKECAPQIPKKLQTFFKILLNGTVAVLEIDDQETTDRKVEAMASDAIYNVTHATVKPWKHTILGLGMSSLTGSKIAMQILNRAGHCIGYHESKGIETEFAYSIESEGRDAPDGILLNANLATGCVWDNNDANIETLDGKETLHSTVGHTYQNIVPEEVAVGSNIVEYRVQKNRRKFVGSERGIAPFRNDLKKAVFVAEQQNTREELNVNLKLLDFFWFYKIMQGDTPLYAGFMSRYIDDPLPLQRICYMDPISKSPTNNDVVKETMIPTMNVAKETGQEYAVVTYDLAIAQKAYSIQAIEKPFFDKMLIMLGNFHIELAFYGAIGTFINESGIEYILREADILAEGSMMGFIRGKFYNRCNRVHELLANVLEQKIYKRFSLELSSEDLNQYQEYLSTLPSDQKVTEEMLSNPVFSDHMEKYEDFFQKVLQGRIGSMAQFWATYVFMINRVYRELQRCIKMNDVNGYIRIFPIVLIVYYALNRPNYARWGSLFLDKLKNSDQNFLELLHKGAFSIRRTHKNYSRSAVDLSLEQTVNRDASSCMKGIVAFRNSENAMRRWSLTMTQRAMAVTELKEYTGLEVGENTAAQCSPSRIRKDNSQMEQLSSKIDEFCDPFSDDTPADLINIATGQVVTKATETYLVNTLERGKEGRDKFASEWVENSSRFLKPLKRMVVHNFAAENLQKKSKSSCKEAKTNAESLRDMFVRLVVVIAKNTAFDLYNVLSYPVTMFPLSLSHSDGSLVKTEKSALLKKLESLQTDGTTENELRGTFATVIDGGLLIHSILSQTCSGASYASIARTILSVGCSTDATEVHICFDKYNELSIKECERRLRGSADTSYSITGPDQTIKQSGQKLLNNGSFKNELAKFVLKEWKKIHYHNIYRRKTVVASFGGDCLKFMPDEEGNISVTKPEEFQGDHEEADTMIAFHVKNIAEKKIVVRASDTDVLVILISFLGNLSPEVRCIYNIVMDCGTGNTRRYINVTNITNVLENIQPGLPKALPGFHAFTGCDFTSAFYRKGKSKPFDVLQKDSTGRFIDLFISMSDGNEYVSRELASEFVCHMYAQPKATDVNEARYNKLVQMTGKINQEEPLMNIRRIDCAMLPPCQKTLEMKIQRSQYVATLWKSADTSVSATVSPTTSGWFIQDNLLKPIWFDGPPIPNTLFAENETGDNGDAKEEEVSDEAWSEESDLDD